MTFIECVYAHELLTEEEVVIVKPKPEYVLPWAKQGYPVCAKHVDSQIQWMDLIEHSEKYYGKKPWD
jgi:hypothetical protein